MRKNHLLALTFVFGVFLLLNPPLLAQSTGVVVAPQDVPDLREWRDFDHGYVYTTSSQERNTKLTLSKDYNGESTMKTGTFNVEQGVKKIRLSIQGSVKSGNINLEVYLPGKKELKKLSMDDSADIQWSQSIDIKEGDNKYYGAWTYVINAQNAKGYYSLSLSTY